MSTWPAPGPGRWTLELAHFPVGQTPVYRGLYRAASREGTQVTMARYGAALSHLEMAHVNDRAYLRPIPLLEPPARLAGSTPPRWALWLLTRVLPRFRRRSRAARRAVDGRIWREDGTHWYEHRRPAVEAANLALQDEEPAILSDDELAGHLARAMANCREGIRLHFELVGPNGLPLGELLAAASDWGIAPREVLGLLHGASPAAAEPARELAPVAGAVAGRGSCPASLDGLRTLGPEAAAALDSYLTRHGHRVVAGFDVDEPTLRELPQLVVGSVRALAERDERDRSGSLEDGTAPVRDRVPQTERPRFDDLLSEARYGYGLRDDNSGLTLHWPSGLLRRALLEAGRRAVATGRAHRPEDLFELTPDEVAPFVAGAGPARPELEERAVLRSEHLRAEAPRTIGPEEPLPDLGALPPALRRVGRAFVACYELLDSAPMDTALAGTGIGRDVVRGRARAASDPSEALERLEPGDVLVVPFTTPAYNAVLPMVSALVVEEGGELSHAAIVARELGIPAVIGVGALVDRVTDGSVVEVDPVAGRVRLLDA